MTDLLKESECGGGELNEGEGKDINQIGRGLTKFRAKSKFYPNLPAGNKIDLFHEVIIQDLNKLKWHMGNENISKQERITLTTLKQDQTIEIKPADKGGNIEIMRKTDYMKEAYRQLLYEECYIILDADPTAQIMKSLIENLDVWTRKVLLNEDEVKYLMVTHPVTPTIYFLPKIHKNEKNPEGRPIVSANGSLLEPLSNYIDYFLSPLVKDLSSYLRDTTYLLHHLKDIPWEKK